MEKESCGKKVWITSVERSVTLKDDLSILFEETPKQWGLRGDPYLWEELRKECVGKAFPYSADAIVEMVCLKFEAVAGVPLTWDARPYVAEYAHGGMSSGHLSGLFWLGRGMAKILQNYYAATEGSGRIP